MAELGNDFVSGLQNTPKDLQWYFEWLKQQQGGKKPAAAAPFEGAPVPPEAPPPAPTAAPDTGSALASAIPGANHPTYGMSLGDYYKWQKTNRAGGEPTQEAPIRPLPTPQELAQGTQPARAPAGDTRPSMSASPRSPSEVARDAQVTALRKGGMSQTEAEDVGGVSSLATETAPVTGTALSGADTSYHLKSGEYGQAALAALGVLPVVGKAAQKGAKVVEKAAGKAIGAAGKGADELEAVAAARKSLATPPPTAAPAEAGAKATTEAIPSSAVEKINTPAAPTLGDAAAAAVQPPAKKGRRQAITNLQSMRGMPIDEAIAQAKTEQHLIPQPGGGYSGAPRNVKSPEDVAAMRNDFDSAVKLGAGVGGDQWYQVGRDIIQEMAPGNPQKQSELARLLGLTSAQANPDTNLGFAMLAHNAYEMGRPAEQVRTTAQGGKYIKARETGEPIKLGPKTYIYGENLDPSKPWTTTGTNDIWHARAFGFTSPNGKPWNAALAPQNHAFLDAETVLAVDRANQAKLGGRDNWTAPEIQAAAWVGRKAQGLVEKAPKKKPIDIAQGLADATVGYADALPKYTAKGTYDLTPGVDTRHLAGVSEGSEATKLAFSQDPRLQWTRNIDGKPYDTLYQSQGALERPTQNTMGIFENPRGQVEQSPGFAARPLVSLAGKSGERGWHPDSKEMLMGVEALRGYGGVQNMAAASQSFPTNKPGRLSSMELPTKGPLSPQTVSQLQAIGAKYDLPHLVDQGDQSVLTNFGGRGAVTTKQQKALQGEVGQIGIDPKAARRTELVSDNIDYSKDWQQPEGSGAATAKLFDNVSDHMAARFDADPAVRAKFRDIAIGHQDWAQRTGTPVRNDVMNALQILGSDGPQGGVSGLKAAMKAGMVSLPAIVGLTQIPDIQQMLGGLGAQLGLQVSQPDGT